MRKTRNPKVLIAAIYMVAQYVLPIIAATTFIYWAVQTYLSAVSVAVPEGEYQKLIELALYGVGAWFLGGLAFLAAIIIAVVTFLIVLGIAYLLNESLDLGL